MKSTNDNNVTVASTSTVVRRDRCGVVVNYMYPLMTINYYYYYYYYYGCGWNTWLLDLFTIFWIFS